MKNKTRSSLLKSNKKMLVLALSLALAILIASGTATYAIFTNSLQAQRTVAAYETAGDMFSSNYLMKGSSGSNIRTIYVTAAGQTPTAVVTVCNYDQGVQTISNANDITYSISARLVKYNGSSYVAADSGDATGYTVTITRGESSIQLSSSKLSYSETFSGTIAGGASHSDAYTVAFSNNFAVASPPNLYLEMTVTPSTPSSLPSLTGIFKISIRSAGTTNSWAGSFSDSTSSAPSAYDGFNYRITGQGSGTFTLKWDSTRIALSQVSLGELLSITGASSTSNSVTFPVDSAGTSTYDIQFYKVNITSESWANDMNSGLDNSGDSPTTVVGYYFTDVVE